MNFTFDPVLLTAFCLALVRAAAWIVVSPPFNTRMIPNTVKAGVAASLALCAAPHLVGPDIPLDTAGFLGALVTQALVGITLGLFTMILVNALQAAGALVDLFAGFSLAAIYDPLNQSNVAIFGRFYELIAVTLLFRPHLSAVRDGCFTFMMTQPGRRSQQVVRNRSPLVLTVAGS